MANTTPKAEPARSPMRARFREQVREDIKTAALGQLAQGGAAAISVNAIAKQLGVSGPALYRYYAGRDELLAELVIDAYHDLAAALAAAAAGDGPPGERLRALATAWRAFARAEPHRYQLLFAPPLPGYDAHSEQLVTAARSVMAIALGVVAGLPVDEGAGSVDLTEVAAAHDDILAATGATPDHLRRTISMWTRLHGFITLELGGNFASMAVDPDALFAEEVDEFTDRPL